MLAQHFFDLTIRGEKRKSSSVFECEYYCDKAVQRILVEINDNHGANNTCVYQFKVHGIAAN